MSINHYEEDLKRKIADRATKMKFTCALCGKKNISSKTRYMIIRHVPEALKTDHSMHICDKCANKISEYIDTLSNDKGVA